MDNQFRPYGDDFQHKSKFIRERLPRHQLDWLRKPDSFYRSLNMFKLGKPEELKSLEKSVFEVICKCDIYTEIEFLHSPEMDELYTEHYEDKFIFNKDFDILEIKNMRSQ
ncbi:MAG: hypothetical protein HWN81_12705 [Candidatus Lokiarchaeota archaeon]|nr:hypothetical protein [Candidatus Lokiarchaeota archaeon]